ncbi:MAG: STAS domain-containing protein [Pseudomonadota bacterium]
MEVTSRQVSGITLIRIAGRIDHDHATALETALAPFLEGPEADGRRPLLLDMAEVGFLTSAGLRVLMIAAKACKHQMRPMAIANLQPMIAEIVRISRFDLIIPVYPSTRAALKAVSPEATGAGSGD